MGDFLFEKHLLPQDCLVGRPCIVRPLEINDFSKGVTECLAALTVVGDLDEDKFRKNFDFMKKSEGHYYIIVVEDLSTGRIAGMGTLLVETKFIRGGSKAGHIEDIVVNQAYRGQNIGKRIIECLVEVSEKVGCYKIILDCAEHNIKFYSKIGFVQKEFQMVRYLTKSKY